MAKTGKRKIANKSKKVKRSQNKTKRVIRRGRKSIKNKIKSGGGGCTAYKKMPFGIERTKIHNACKKRLIEARNRHTVENYNKYVKGTRKDEGEDEDEDEGEGDVEGEGVIEDEDEGVIEDEGDKVNPFPEQ